MVCFIVCNEEQAEKLSDYYNNYPINVKIWRWHKNRYDNDHENDAWDVNIYIFPMLPVATIKVCVEFGPMDSPEDIISYVTSWHEFQIETEAARRNISHPPVNHPEWFSESVLYKELELIARLEFETEIFSDAKRRKRNTKD